MRLDVEHASIIDSIHDQILPLDLETQLSFLVCVGSMEEHCSSGLNDINFFIRNLNLKEIEGMRQDKQKIIAEGQHYSAVQ